MKDMLIIIIGNDSKKRSKVILDSDIYNEGVKLLSAEVRGEDVNAINQYLSPDLFGNFYKVRISDWNREEVRKDLYNLLEAVRDSKSLFIIDELDILDATLNKISKYAYKVYDCREVEVKESAFKLLDLVLAKRKKEAWLEYMRLLSNGEAIESIIGILNYGFNKRHDISGSFILLKAFADGHDSKGNAEHEVEKLILKL